MSDELRQLGHRSDTGIRWPELEAEGWIRRNVTDPVRAPELESLYESLGFEVKLQTTTPEQFPGNCDGCATSCATKIFVYTRKKNSGVNDE
ncbi:MAG: hypothetical protein GY811_23545 [Myxococcales bacterium]|nr:hypothetical protein [Myxococcales bacterium]